MVGSIRRGDKRDIRSWMRLKGGRKVEKGGGEIGVGNEYAGKSMSKAWMAPWPAPTTAGFRRTKYIKMEGGGKEGYICPAYQRLLTCLGCGGDGTPPSSCCQAAAAAAAASAASSSQETSGGGCQTVHLKSAFLCVSLCFVWEGKEREGGYEICAAW